MTKQCEKRCAAPDSGGPGIAMGPKCVLPVGHDLHHSAPPSPGFIQPTTSEEVEEAERTNLQIVKVVKAIAEYDGTSDYDGWYRCAFCYREGWNLGHEKDCAVVMAQAVCHDADIEINASPVKVREEGTEE